MKGTVTVDCKSRSLMSLSATRPSTIKRSRPTDAFARPRVRRLIATLVFAALAVGAAWALLTQAEVIVASLDAMRHADRLLIVVGIVLVAVRYWAAAASLQAATPHHLPFGGTLSTQLATAAVGRLTPEAIGWLVLNLRFLQRVGLGMGQATAAISLKLAAGVIGRVGFALAVAWSVAATPGSPQPGIDLPTAFGVWALVLVTVSVVVASFLLRRSDRVRAKVEPALRDLAALRHDPARAARLVGTTLLLSVLPALTLAVAAAAVGIDIPASTIFAVYLVGSAIAAASPTPGNLGAVEAALSAGLTGAGAPPSDALAAVLIYRLLTFWLPILPGLVAFRWAQRAKYL
jgi:uncharacterized membrane protein YbhN (UPF0104 family)